MKTYSCLLLLSLTFLACGSQEEEQAMTEVFQQYQAAVESEDADQLMALIERESRAYLLKQLEYLQQNDREAVQAYVSKTQHPVLNIDMMARALNHYSQSELEKISAEEFMEFNLGYLFQLEQPLIKEFTFREKMTITEDLARLKFSRPMVDVNEVITMVFVREEDGWKLNLIDRLHVLENNVRVILKYAEISVWQHIAEQLDKYYPRAAD